MAERGDRTESVLRAFKVEFRRVGPAAFVFGDPADGLSEEESNLASILLDLIDERFPIPR